MSEKELVDNVMIASPCNVGWENMAGDERVRFCGSCKLNVYNTSQMSKKEVVALMADDKASCLRIYRRADGTMLTEDCPVGLRRLRDTGRKLVKVAASLWAVALSCTSVFAQVPKAEGSKDKTPVQDPRFIEGNVYVVPPVKAGEPVSAQGGSASGADRTVVKFLEAAKASQLKKDDKAAEHSYKQATDALTKSKHDPAFEKQVWFAYADFLAARNRQGEAQAIRNKPQFQAAPAYPTIGEKTVDLPLKIKPVDHK